MMEKPLKQINRSNFFKNTFCVFQEINSCEIKKEDFKYHSKSGSLYYFTDEGVFRYSNHWGRVGNCRWRLVKSMSNKTDKQTIGFAKWEDFFENDDVKQLFFIDQNEAQIYEANHKNHPRYDKKWAVFSAQESKKRLQTIASIQENPHWAQYLNIENNTENQQKAIELLRTTRLEWLEIKRILSK